MGDFQSISIRLPREIFERIKKMAAKNHRSINQQVNVYTEEGLNNQEAKKEEQHNEMESQTTH